MEQVFKDLGTKSVVPWIAALVALIAFADLGLHSHQWKYEVQASVGVAWTGLAVFLGHAVYRAAFAGVKHLLTVCVWSAVIVLSAIFCAYYVFFTWPGSSDQYERVLNVLPVLTAVWAAGLGWFVHFQLTSKAHRTKNSFDLLMQSRTNPEFRKHADVVTKHFPPGTTIPDEYRAYYHSNSRKLMSERIQQGQQVPDIEVERVSAISSLKYVLNYYEFMAVGIKKGDLDPDLLYESVSVLVINTYKRALPLIDYLTREPSLGGAGEVLAFCHLRTLVSQWEVKYDEEVAARSRA